MQGYKQFLLKDMLAEIGEDKVKVILSSFICPMNHDVENFLHTKAIEFEKRKFSSTYLIFASNKDKMRLAGYFALAIKTFSVSRKPADKKNPVGQRTTASKRAIKMLPSFGTYNSLLNAYTVPAPLIGQLARNFNDECINLISGDELLKIACDKVREMQKFFSGNFVYLECEDKPKLIEFYSSNGFVEFGKRQLDRDEKDDLSGDYLVQMLRDLRAEQ
jgi:hypothetical protein